MHVYTWYFIIALSLIFFRSYLVEQKNLGAEVPSIIYLYPQNGILSALFGVSAPT